MKEKNFLKLAIVLFSLLVISSLITACYYDEPSFKDTEHFYTEGGEVDCDAVADFFFDVVWYDEEMEAELNQYFFDKYDVYGLYEDIEEINESNILDIAKDIEDNDDGEDTAALLKEELEEIIDNNTYYIINTSSRKYHKSSCSFGQQTSEKNKEISYGTSDEIEARGYSPCGKCCP